MNLSPLKDEDTYVDEEYPETPYRVSAYRTNAMPEKPKETLKQKVHKHIGTISIVLGILAMPTFVGILYGMASAMKAIIPGEANESMPGLMFLSFMLLVLFGVFTIMTAVFLIPRVEHFLYRLTKDKT